MFKMIKNTEAWTISFDNGNLLFLTDEEYRGCMENHGKESKSPILWFDGKTPDLVPIGTMFITYIQEWASKEDALVKVINNNIQRLFFLQKGLDNVILERFPELKTKNNFYWRINALQVEFGEFLQEWQGFKMWKGDRKPNTKVIKVCNVCGGSGTPIGIPVESGVECYNCEDASGEIYHNPMLEEYVDTFHFILSIGLDRGINISSVKVNPFNYKTSIENEMDLNKIIFHWNHMLYRSLQRTLYNEVVLSESDYSKILSLFIAIGFELGFEWNDIVYAYLNKNQKNHLRQANNY